MDISERGAWLTAPESRLLMGRLSNDQHASLVARIREAQQNFAQAQEVVDPRQEESAAKNILKRIVSDLSKHGLLSEPLFWPKLRVEMALESAKDDAGVDSAVVGPLSFSLADLQEMYRVAEEAGTDAQEKIAACEEVMSRAPEQLNTDQKVEQLAIRTVIYPEAMSERFAANGIVHAIRDYLG